MENLKTQWKTTIYIELHGFIMEKSNRTNGLNKEDALEIGSYVAANFITSTFNNNGKVTPEDINAIFGNINDFFTESFSNQYTQTDYIEIKDKAMEIMANPDSNGVIKTFFMNLMPR